MFFISLNQDSVTEILDECGYATNAKDWFDSAPVFERSWIDRAIQTLPTLTSLDYPPRVWVSSDDIELSITVFRSGRVELGGGSERGFSLDASWIQTNLSDARELLWRFVVEGPSVLERLDWQQGACSICYVCGSQLDCPPWGIDLNSPTYDICRCCRYEFGLPTVCHHCDIKQQRAEWLCKLGLDPNCIDFEVIPQLRNVPTDYHRGWYCSGT